MSAVTSLAGPEMERMLSAEPTVHPTAHVMDSRLGPWTFVDEGAEILESSMGDYSYIMRFGAMAYTIVGKFCSLASFVRLNPGNHPMERVTTHHLTYRSRMYGLSIRDDEAFFDWRRVRPVRIGHDVWIGHNATVLPGVTVGNGAVIGAGSVVTHDVPPCGVVVGVPARLLRMRFPQDVVERLQEIAWWDWPRRLLKERWEEFKDLDAFLEKFAAE